MIIFIIINSHNILFRLYYYNDIGHNFNDNIIYLNVDIKYHSF